MHWAWTFTIYVDFALITWIQAVMIILREVHCAPLYMPVALIMLFVALLPQVRIL